VALHALTWYMAFRVPPPQEDATVALTATLAPERGRWLPDRTYLLL
jgi:hypothetical protein